MTDPFYALLLMHRLGSRYHVWDQAASIEFVAPGRGTAGGAVVEDDLCPAQTALPAVNRRHGKALSGLQLQPKGTDMPFVKVIAVLVAAALAAPAFAQTDSTRRIDKRQKMQERRIEQGQKSGQLTEKEAARLEKGQARVQKMEDKAAADGKIGAKDRVRIEKAQDRQSKRIYRERHDKQTAK